MPWRLFAAGVLLAGRFDARALLRHADGTSMAIRETFQGGGEQAIKRARLERFAFRGQLRGELDVTLPNAFGEGGSPADG